MLKYKNMVLAVPSTAARLVGAKDTDQLTNQIYWNTKNGKYQEWRDYIFVKGTIHQDIKKENPDSIIPKTAFKAWTQTGLITLCRSLKHEDKIPEVNKAFEEFDCDTSSLSEQDYVEWNTYQHVSNQYLQVFKDVTKELSHIYREADEKAVQAQERYIQHVKDVLGMTLEYNHKAFLEYRKGK